MAGACDTAMGILDRAVTRDEIPGWVLERPTGHDGRLLRRRLPGARLATTRYGPLPPPHDDVAATEVRADATAVVATVHDETAVALRCPTGHAGLFSNAADLGTYLAAWVDPGEDWLPWRLRRAATADRGDRTHACDHCLSSPVPGSSACTSSSSASTCPARCSG